MALDEHKDGDAESKVKDFTFLIENTLADNYGNFKIDYSDGWLKRGFSVTPAGFSGGC